jgi:predicted SnoaL-like aldol condensation-catalyzing enzyme
VNSAQTAAAIDFMQLIVANRIAEAYRRHVATGFRHHNPYFRSDADSLRQGMEENAKSNPAKKMEILRTIEQGPLVAVHSRIRQNATDPGAATVHIFRFEQGRIAELWDVGQAAPPDAVNELGMW